RQTYDRYSRLYDLIGGQFERKYALLGVQQLRLQSGERVLEIGYGTGHMLVAMAEDVGETGHVYGIDISSGMYRIANQRLHKAGVVSQVTIVVGDALELPFQSNFFDAVFMSFTLELFDTPEIPFLLQQCKRVLKPTGRLGVVALAKKHPAGLVQRVYESLHDFFPHWVDCRPIYPSKILQKNGFMIINNYQLPMFGLQVELVLARNR
ncbi:MAG: class I SAM-dependent methyltransferase, partial [Candidatus Hodarchaeota archaeon]